MRAIHTRRSMPRACRWRIQRARASAGGEINVRYAGALEATDAHVIVRTGAKIAFQKGAR